MRTILGWVVFGPFNYGTLEAKSVNRASTGDVGLTELSVGMHEIDFVYMQSLDEGFLV